MSEPRADLDDTTGRTVGTYLPGERDGRPWADKLEPVPGVAQADVVAAVVTQLAGHGVTSTPELGDTLIATKRLEEIANAAGEALLRIVRAAKK